MTVKEQLEMIWKDLACISPLEITKWKLMNDNIIGFPQGYIQRYDNAQ